MLSTVFPRDSIQPDSVSLFLGVVVLFGPVSLARCSTFAEIAFFNFEFVSCHVVLSLHCFCGCGSVLRVYAFGDIAVRLRFTHFVALLSLVASEYHALSLQQAPCRFGFNDLGRLSSVW